MSNKAKRTDWLLAAGCVLLLLGAHPFLGVAFNTHAPHNLSAAVLAASCSGCHERARSTEPIPSLYNRTAVEIQDALLAFRSDRRKGTVMNKIAKGYSEAEIGILAEYLARNASSD